MTFVAYRALTCLFFSAASQAVAQGGNANAIASSSKSLSWYLVLSTLAILHVSDAFYYSEVGTKCDRR